jgi:predicted AAA+ superfamily ATPase
MFSRIIKPHLLRLSTQYPIVTMTGPRQSGKTTVCQATFPDYEYINLEALSIRDFANNDPQGFLSRIHSGVILDEIQRAPNLASYIQPIVDKEKKPGRFILTGSQQFEISQTINQSLAGRTALLKLLPLSYPELYATHTPKNIGVLLYAGFYPRIFDQHLNPTEALSFYLSTYVERDIRSLIHVKDLSTFERFLKICATQIGQLLNYTTIANDCGIDQKTVKSWLSVLEASYILFQVQPHYQHFRKRFTKSTKLYFYDVALAAYLLGISNASHLLTNPAKGFLFENFVVTEFIKNRFNHVKDSNIYFYRDRAGNEVDIILDYGDELYSVEIKSSETINLEFFKGLNFYKDLAGDKNTRRFIVYAGTESYETNHIKIFSYQHINQLFAEINER